MSSDSPAPRTPDRRQFEDAAATIKGAIGALLDAGGYHLPEAQLALLLELSFKAGCMEMVLAQGDMDAIDVEAAWQGEKARRSARLHKAGLA